MPHNRFGFGHNLGQDVLSGLGVGLNALTGQGLNLNQLEANQLLGTLEQQPLGAQLGSQQFARLTQLAPEQANVFQGLVQARGEEAKTRTAALAQDALSASRFLAANRPDKAEELLTDRISVLRTQGRDITDTREIRDLISSGKLDEADELLTFGLQAFADEGVIPNERFMEFRDGKAIFQNFRGELVVRDVEGAGQIRKDQQPQINVLRKDISNVTKDQKKIDAAFRKIEKAGAKATAAGDMSLIFSFMKILDPGSTVREGEFATAQQAAGVPERVLNFYNRARDGTRLGPNQRKDFLNQASLLSEAQRESADLSIENILQQADQDEIGRERVFGKKRLSDFNKRVQGRIPPTEPVVETVTPIETGITDAQIAELKAARPDLTEEQIRELLK